MSANIQDNNVTGETTVLIEVSVETAEALASLLGHVSDMTANDGLSRLYEALTALGPIVADNTVLIEENPMAQDEDDDQFNIVVA